MNAHLDERAMCLGKECPDKRCEVCPAKNKKQLDPTDFFRTGPGVSPNGYYSSNGIVRIRDPKTGKIRYNYARQPISYEKSEDKKD